jgi:amidohydrolase
MGGEDMSYFLERVPGCYFFLGTRNEARGLVHPHHSPRFDLDESALVIGVEIMTRVVRSYLRGSESSL